MKARVKDNNNEQDYNLPWAPEALISIELLNVFMKERLELYYLSPVSVNNKFKSKVETEISARYAEKIAYMVDYPVLDIIDEKCAIYGLPLMKRASEPVIPAGEMFPLLQGEG